MDDERSFEGGGLGKTPMLSDEALAELAPRVDGLADAAERDRIFAALFDMPTERRKLGRYLVLGVLGRGAMGTVLEAYDEGLERRLAIKILQADTSERDAKRLLREAKALAKLSHPNVVQVYEAGEVEGQVFIAMELVRGVSLQRWQRQQRRPWQECVSVYLQAAWGLAAAHAAGLIHRDFKPSNCIVDDQGRVRVLDFGLARKLDAAALMLSGAIPAEPSVLTTPGAVLGTLAYMPLEQLQGDPADERSDQFSFCVSLYEAIHAERPFRGDSVVATTKGAVRSPPKGVAVPARLRRLLLRGLAIKPENRWPSMNALVVELERLVAPRRAWWRVPSVALTVMGIGVAGLRRLLLRVRGLRWRTTALPAARLRAAPEVEASVLSSIGVVLSASGRLDEALTHLQRALAIFEEALGPRHPNVALVHGNIGAVLHQQGRLDEASIHHRNALGIYEEALGPRHPELARLLQGLAELALASHDPDAAREHAERALSIREAGEVAPELLAECRFVLARASWADHSERSRSRVLAEQARDAYAALGDAKRGALAEVVAWLAEHRMAGPNA